MSGLHYNHGLLPPYCDVIGEDFIQVVLVHLSAVDNNDSKEGPSHLPTMRHRQERYYTIFAYTETEFHHIIHFKSISPLEMRYPETIAHWGHSAKSI